MTSTIRQWTNVSAGPRQVKDLSKAVSELQWEGRNREEVYGVIGGKEHRSVVAAMLAPVRDEVVKLDEEIREAYGYQLTKDNIRAVIADYQAAVPEAQKSRPVDDNRRTAEEDAELTAQRTAQGEAQRAKEAASKALLDQVKDKAPATAKALIYAELHEDTSDLQADYHGSRVIRTVAIGFRTSTREDFRALRAAASAFPETAHLAVGDTERRENYSMGGGNFLSDHGSSDSGSGWVVRSRDFPCAYVSLTEDAIPEPSAAPEPASAPRVSMPVGPRPVQATPVPPEVLDILRTATADGRFVKIAGRLSRETYVKLADVLKVAGGKWNRGAQAFLFGEDAAPVLAKLLGDGSITRPQDEGWFPTPAPVVTQLLEAAGVKPGMTVLEPSAGEGAIARAAVALGCTVDAVEQNAKRAAVLYESGAARSVAMGDFLAQPARPEYDAVVMNPPFASKADIAHVRHALGFLRSGGTLAAVMSNGVTFREDRPTADFREMFTRAGGTFKPLPDDAFKASGTDVRTVLAVIIT